MSESVILDDNVVGKVSIFDYFETDTDAEENGKWFTDIMNDGSGIDLKLRRVTSKAAQKVQERLQRANQRFMKNGKFPDDVAEQIAIHVLAEGCIVDWRNIVDREGKAIPCTKETAVMLLTKLPTFRNLVFNYANMLANWRTEQVKEIEGNS